MSNLFTDIIFASEVSSRLDKCVRRGNIWNFRCPLCGDSTKNKNKKRGYIYQKDNGLQFKCHNCQECFGLGNFLKTFAPDLYQRYAFESFKPKQKIEPKEYFEKTFPVTKSKNFRLSEYYPNIGELGPNHSARKYIENRKIPDKFLSTIYYVKDFKKLVDDVLPNNTFGLSSGDERVVIPFNDRERNLFAFQGRSLNPYSKSRYITIKLKEDSPKIWGLDLIDENQLIYITEGPFDAMFLPNAIAAAGAAAKIPFKPKNCVWIYDAQRSNNQIIKKMIEASNNGFGVCIWPLSVPGKDINEFILAGWSQEKVLETIKQNTFHGMEARFNIATWRK